MGSDGTFAPAARYFLPYQGNRREARLEPKILLLIVEDAGGIMIKQPLAPAAIAAVAAVVAVWAGAPVSTVLPIALLLVCPVMMLLMMRSMSGETTDHDQQAPDHDRVRDSKGSDVS